MESNQGEVNNLKKFGTPFQAKCLAAMLSDRAFLERIIDIVSRNTSRPTPTSGS